MSDRPTPPETLRILMISKACVVGIYQRKLEEIATHPGIELTVAVPPAWESPSGSQVLERAYTTGYRLVVEPIRFNGNFHLHYYPRIGRLIDRIRPHILHIDEEPYNFATFHALRAGRQVGAKALFFSWQNLLRRYPPPFSWMERWVLAHVDYGIAGTQEAVEVWRAKGYPGPLALIPQFGVDAEIFSPAGGPRERDHLAIGYAGRMVEEKGIDTLIRAVAGLPGEWTLSLLGQGPRRDTLRELAEQLKIGERVRFESPIPSTEIPAYYHRLDALVLPSRTRPNWKEQFGRVMIEAMACGVPVIGSDSGAIPGVIGEAGLIFPEGEVETLRDGLLALMRQPDLRRDLAERGRKRVLERFTQAQIAAQTVAVYREMMIGRR